MAQYSQDLKVDLEPENAILRQLYFFLSTKT